MISRVIGTQREGYERDLAYDAEVGFRFAFSHPDDRQRKLTVTILAFDVRPVAQRGTQEG